MFSCYRTNRCSITLLQHYTCEKWITCIVVQYSLIPIHSPLHHCSTTAPLAFLSFTLPSLPPYRSLVSLLPQSWQTGWRIVITSSCYQLKHLLYLPTSVSSNSMGGGGWGLLCRMRTSSQWYEVTEVRLFTLEQYGVFITFSFHFSLLHTVSIATCSQYSYMQSV